MSRKPSLERLRNPARAGRLNRQGGDWRSPCLVLAMILFVPVAAAENLGMELLSTGITPATLYDEPGDSIDEIVVLGVREKDDAERTRRLLEDPLLQHILRDFELRQQLERETGHGEEAAGIGPSSPRLRVGYEPPEESREPSREEPSRLPLDLVKPAIVIEFDF